MSDEEILEEVYRMALRDKRMYAPAVKFSNKIVSFIEQEWQRQDEESN